MAYGTTDPWLTRVRLLNDEARRHLPDGKVVFTRGIASLPQEEQAAILDRVRTFDDFGPHNDPWGEHDFGAFEHAGHHVFWKIDYFDREERFGSAEPSDPAVTKRVLTIMLAGEY
jgi:Protein of unknown function (DUF3768)